LIKCCYNKWKSIEENIIENIAKNLVSEQIHCRDIELYIKVQQLYTNG